MGITMETPQGLRCPGCDPQRLCIGSPSAARRSGPCRLIRARESQQRMDRPRGLPPPLSSLPTQQGPRTCTTSLSPLGRESGKQAAGSYRPPPSARPAPRGGDEGGAKASKGPTLWRLSPTVPNLFSTRDQFCGRNVSMHGGGAGEGGFGFTSHSHPAVWPSS